MPQRLSTTLTQKDSRGDAAFLTSPETPLPIRKVSVATRQAYVLVLLMGMSTTVTFILLD